MSLDHAEGRNLVNTGHSFALQIKVNKPTNIDEVREIVHGIIKQFKKNVEEKKLYTFLYKPDGRPYHEVYAQRLFFSVAGCPRSRVRDRGILESL